MKTEKRWILGITVLLLPLLVVANRARAQAGTKVRWDIISISPPLSAGGVASAKANDESKITLTGSGIFEPDDPEEVTGGGTWTTFNSSGATTGSGTYEVKRLVRWDQAPGTLPAAVPDLIGNPAERGAGLAVLRIRYSDGKQGILVVSCHLDGTPDSLFEGITASKGFVDFWNRVRPVPGVNANRTLFHVTPEDND